MKYTVEGNDGLIFAIAIKKMDLSTSYVTRDLLALDNPPIVQHGGVDNLPLVPSLDQVLIDA
jgi:hypothetical protein